MNFIFTALRMTPMMGGFMRNFSTRVQAPNIINGAPTSVFGLGGSAPTSNQSGGLLAAVQQLSVGSIIGRTNIRCHFPRPNERKRIRKHGWKARMSTPAGRRVIMRRILKGRHVLTH